MRKILITWFLASLVLNACQPTNVAEPTIIATLTGTPLPTNTPSPSITPTPLPSPTPTATSVPYREARLRQSLQEWLASEHWPPTGLPEQTVVEWQALAENLEDTSLSEQPELQHLLDQWDKYARILEKKAYPSGVRPRLLVSRSTGNPHQWSLYAIDQTANPDGENPPYLLVTHEVDPRNQALIRAPQIDGLSQRLSADGEYIEYIDPTGNLLLTADARYLDSEEETQFVTGYMINQQYKTDTYSLLSVYPRYRFHIEGVESGFYALDTLTHKQIQLLLSTFDLYNLEDFKPLKSYVFPPGDRVAFVISRTAHDQAAAQAIPMGWEPRRGVIILYSKNLFENRYNTASSIAHEAAHILQGKTPGCEFVEQRKQREIGSGVIPADFYDWDAVTLISQVRQNQVGAYHVSLWMLTKMGIQDHARWQQRVILSGTVNGYPVGICTKP